MSNVDTQKLKDYISSSYSFTPTSIEYIKEGVTNTNFIVSNNSERYVFKVYNFKSLKEVEFEVGVLLELEKHNVKAPVLVECRDSTYLQEYEGKPCLMYHYIDGAPEEKWSLSTFFDAGVYMGNIHALLLDYPDTSKEGTFDLEKTRTLVKRGHKRFKDAHYPEADVLLSFVDSCLSTLSFPEELPRGVTHHDIKSENVILKEGSLAGVVDFDLSYHGVLLNDIATTIIWTCFNGNELDVNKVKKFLEGYETKRTLGSLEWEYLPEAIYCRLVREVFSSPFDVLPNYIDVTKIRSDEFKERAIAFKAIKDSLDLRHG